jgi:RNA polymerase sigma-70 factor (ECF subfamily)
MPSSEPDGSDAVPQEDDRSLVDRAKAGDQSALGQLFDRHYDRVYRYIRFKVGLEQDAEDLAQEVFLRMYQALERYQYRGVPFRAFLMQVAANLVNDFYRKRGSGLRAASLESNEIDVAGSDDPAEMVLTQASFAEVVGAMSSLTELEREVIQLRYAAELSIAETAAVTGKNENNIKQLTFKALGKLRKVLNQADAGNP